MAQKRMFDRAIIDTDKFMDLSMSAKALYFLLGMEADDEGFVSYKKVMRIHGGNEDDIKILVAKNFILAFESGVVVITDWNRNNYLDKNRIRETEYQKEKKSLLLTDKGVYVLRNGSTSIEESSIEQSRGEDKKVPVLVDNLPDWINRESWNNWVEYRKEKRQKLTERMIKLQIKLLSGDINNHVEIIENSIRNGWTGLFPLKRDGSKKMYVV